MQDIPFFFIFFCLLLILFFTGPICFALVFNRRRRTNYFKQYEGTEFFCYTNRQNSQTFIETHILPQLDPIIEIIHLQGRTPISNFEEEYISYALYRLKEVGFPNIMKIINGQIVDRSLHHELYRTINQNLPPASFLQILEQKRQSLEAPTTRK